MEIVWMDIRYIDPPIEGKEYFVTVYNPLWAIKYQTMVMTWAIEEHRGKQTNIWKYQDNKKVSTWEVTHWMNKPNPAIREDE